MQWDGEDGKSKRNVKMVEAMRLGDLLLSEEVSFPELGIWKVEEEGLEGEVMSSVLNELAVEVELYSSQLNIK